MATFTMNSQKALVQSSGVKNGLDKAFLFSMLLLLLVGGLWGTERVLIYLAEKQTKEYQDITTAQLNAINAEEVQDVHDITSRIAAIKKQQSAQVDIGGIFSSLERTTIPQVKLTSFEYGKGGEMILDGIASDYRFLAEQLMRYRQEALFANSEVVSTGRNEAGQVTFIVKVEPNKTEEVQASAPMTSL